MPSCISVANNLYLEELNKNIQFAQELAAAPDMSALKRIPPETIK